VVRTEQFRYVRYADGSEGLYDENSDPMEWTNLTGKAEYTSVKQALAKWMPTVNVPDEPATDNGSPGGSE